MTSTRLEFRNYPVQWYDKLRSADHLAVKNRQISMQCTGAAKSGVFQIDNSSPRLGDCRRYLTKNTEDKHEYAR